MQIHILLFGLLKDWYGSSADTIELPEGATVGDLLMGLESSSWGDRPASMRDAIAVSVNAEYTTASHILHDGDEVGLLPPVSGGSAAGMEGDVNSPALTLLTRDVIDSNALIAASKRSDDGAVVVFDGVVRNHTRNRQTLYLDYEAYEEMAAKQMDALARDAIVRFDVRRVTLVHRLGRLNVGETSVLIVVASAHRAPAFDACRWLIDTLKKTVPIWKKETFVDGVVWAAGEPFPEGIAISVPETPHGK